MKVDLVQTGKSTWVVVCNGAKWTFYSYSKAKTFRDSFYES